MTVSVVVLPTVTAASLNEMAVTGTGAGGVGTVTVQVAVLLPSSVVTVIVAVPAETAVTTPSVTVATLELDEDHVTFWLSALDGEIVAVNVSELPISIVVDCLLRDTLSTATGAA